MPGPLSTTFTVDVPDEGPVTAKLTAPEDRAGPGPVLLLAHGANNDLDFPLLAYLGTRLAEVAGMSVVRFNFPYVERGASSPDSRPVLEKTFMRLHQHVRDELAPSGTPVFVGGKSLGGRTATELVSRGSEGTGVTAAGLVVLGYPLHAPGHKDRLNLEPLRHVAIPSLFFAGSRDPFCDTTLMRPLVADFVLPGKLVIVKGGDHSLHLPASAGRHPEDSYEPVAQEIAAFVSRALADRGRG